MRRKWTGTIPWRFSVNVSSNSNVRSLFFRSCSSRGCAGVRFFFNYFFLGKSGALVLLFLEVISRETEGNLTWIAIRCFLEGSWLLKLEDESLTLLVDSNRLQTLLSQRDYSPPSTASVVAENEGSLIAAISSSATCWAMGCSQRAISDMSPRPRISHLEDEATISFVVSLARASVIEPCQGSFVFRARGGMRIKRMSRIVKSRWLPSVRVQPQQLEKLSCVTIPTKLHNTVLIFFYSRYLFKFHERGFQINDLIHTVSVFFCFLFALKDPRTRSRTWINSHVYNSSNFSFILFYPRLLGGRWALENWRFRKRIRRYAEPQVFVTPARLLRAWLRGHVRSWMKLQQRENTTHLRSRYEVSRDFFFLFGRACTQTSSRILRQF
jgi:hypothetical protein